MRWVFLVLAVVISVGFYRLRSSGGILRILYGAIEITAGLAIFLILFGIIPTATLLTADNTPGMVWLIVPNTVAFLTGVYALVRGLDNIITELRS